MESGKFRKHRSWLISAAIAALIGLWLLSGQIGADDATQTEAVAAATTEAPRSSVRVRTQSAEEVQRTITESILSVEICPGLGQRFDHFLISGRRGIADRRGDVVSTARRIISIRVRPTPQ